MKKILAIFLALITVLSIALVACNKDNTTRGDNTNDDDGDGDLIVGSQSTGDSEQDGSDAGSDSGTPSDSWETITYSIYTMAKATLREDASLKATDAGTVEANTTLQAVAKKNNWYKVSYNNRELCIHADLVTTNASTAKFSVLATADQVTLKVKDSGDSDKPYTVNLRKAPVVSDDIATIEHTIDHTDTANGELKKVGVNETGNWYIVEYKGGTYYLKINSSTSAYLDDPSAAPDGPGALG